MKKLLYLYVLLFICLQSTLKYAQESTCYGSTQKGALEKGVKLPVQGANYITYDSLGLLAERTYVHSSVKKVVVAAYKQLESEQPEKLYKFAETGFAQGGEFKPHKTHQNGLSVDFMTPVVNAEGKSVLLPTDLTNKFGYAIEFDKDSKYKKYRIDYTALAAHLVSLDRQAKKQGIGIWRVIFDPQLQKHLFATKYGDYLIEHIQFSKKRSWVRHDEHYHVDFSIPCESLELKKAIKPIE